MANNVKILIETLYKGQGTKQATEDLKKLRAEEDKFSAMQQQMASRVALLNQKYKEQASEVKKLADAQKQAKEQTKANFDALKQGAAIAVASFVAMGAALNKALDIGAEGAGIERLEESFQSLARVAGVSGDALLESLDRAARGTVSNTDLILSANRAMMLGLGADAEQLGKLMEIAAFRGRAMGLTTQQAFSDIVTGIGRASPMILDNLGIMTKGWTEEAQAAGVAFDAQFVLNKVLEDGGKQLQQVGGLVDDTASSYERLDANMKNATDSGKKQLGEFLEPLTRAWNDSFSAQERANQLIKEGVPPQVALSMALRESANATVDYTQAEEGAIDTRRESIDSLQNQGNALQENATAVEENAEAVKALSNAYSNILSTAEQLNREEEKYIEDANDRSVRLHEIEQEKVRLQIEKNAVQAAGNLTIAERNKFMLRQIELDNEYNQILMDGQKAEQDRAEATKQRVYDLVEQRLALEGISSEEFSYLQNLQVQMGLVTRADADKAIQISQSADEFVNAFQQQTGEVDTLHDSLSKITQDSPYRAQIVIETIGGIPTLGGQGVINTHEQTLFNSPLGGGFAEGGSFVVPGTGTGDRPYMVGLTPGERVTVTPQGESGGVNVNINIANIRALSDIDYLVQEVQRRIA